jgi:hypothetical protein
MPKPSDRTARRNRRAARVEGTCRSPPGQPAKRAANVDQFRLARPLAVSSSASPCGRRRCIPSDRVGRPARTAGLADRLTITIRYLVGTDDGESGCAEATLRALATDSRSAVRAGVSRRARTRRRPVRRRRTGRNRSSSMYRYRDVEASTKARTRAGPGRGRRRACCLLFLQTFLTQVQVQAIIQRF